MEIYGISMNIRHFCFRNSLLNLVSCDDSWWNMKNIRNSLGRILLWYMILSGNWNTTEPAQTGASTQRESRQSALRLVEDGWRDGALWVKTLKRDIGTKESAGCRYIDWVHAFLFQLVLLIPGVIFARWPAWKPYETGVSFLLAAIRCY